MKRNILRAASAVAVIFLSAPTAGASEVVDCTAPASWFPHEQTPPPDDNADFNSNCAFHQWSWQAFLALTKKTKAGPLVFETMIPASDVISGTRSAGHPAFRPRTAKSDGDQGLDEVQQAGSLGVLVDPSGRVVYYSQYVNETYYDFVVTENEFTDPANILAAPDDLNYPIGALTLKAAWKIVTEGEDTSDFYTTRALVQVLTTDANGNVVVDPDRSREETLALVGLHIVGVVKGHPEAIWATFEHRRNAPEFAANSAADSPVSSSDFTFYQANTTAAECNQNNAGHLTLTDPAAQTLSPVTQACRQYPFGGGNSTNIANIASMNTSAHAQLSKESVWQNYMETGAIWFKKSNALQPNMMMDDTILTGSVKLSSSVIETFTQKTVNEDNCFACHNTQARYPQEDPDKLFPGKNLNISHILVNTYLSNLKSSQ